MNQPDTGAATVRQPWTLRSFLDRRAVSPTADEAAVKLTLTCLIGSRLLVWLGALGAIAIFGRNAIAIAGFDPQHLTAVFRASWANYLFAPAARWDSVWYLQIAHFGYFSRQSSSFFPLYPLLVRSGAGLFGSELVVATLISITSMTISLYLLHGLARLDMSDQAARTTVLLLAFFPTAFFLSAVYTEALFLMLSIGAIYAGRCERWGWASVLGGLAAASRSNGVLIALPLVLMYLYGPRLASPRGRAGVWWRPRYRLSRSALWLLLVPAGLVAYLAYLWIAHDAPLAPFQAEHLWQRQFAGPFGAVVRLLADLPRDLHRMAIGSTLPVEPGDPVSWTAHNLIDLGFLVFSAAGLWWCWRRVPRIYFIYALVMLAQTLSEPVALEPLKSFPRYMLVIFPLFMGWGGWLADHRRTRYGTLAVSGVLLVVFSGLWGIWAWVA